MASRLRVRKFVPTQCPQGHAYTIENTYWQYRHGPYKAATAVCKACDKLRMQRKRDDSAYRAQGAARQRKYRLTHPVEYKAAYTKEHDKKKQVLLAARVGGCIKCGEKDVACLDFHHRDGKATKAGNIGDMRRYAMGRLLEEIAKCDVLCANCHRKHHRDERSTYASVD